MNTTCCIHHTPHIMLSARSYTHTQSAAHPRYTHGTTHLTHALPHTLHPGCPDHIQVAQSSAVSMTTRPTCTQSPESQAPQDKVRNSSSLHLPLLLGLSRTTQVTRTLPHLRCLVSSGAFLTTVLPGLEPTGPDESVTSRLSSRPSLPPPGGKGQAARPASHPPPLPLPPEGKCQIPCLSGGSGRVGGGVIQPPHECAVRRAFPAITQRGRGWLANGFNYHSDRNAGWRLRAPHSSGRAHLQPACAAEP